MWGDILIMTENTLQLVQSLKIVWLAGFAALYGFGGVSGKWKRRIVGSCYLTLGIVGFSLWESNFHWLYISYALLLWGALSIGYGVNSDLQKLLQNKYLVRAVVGFALAFSSIPIAIACHQWTLFFLHTALCISTSTILGVINPTKSARAEETVIATVTGFLPLYFFS